MDTAPTVTFGTLLRRYRIAAGLTQEELAERAGISRRSLGDMERGTRLPRKDTLGLVAEALGLPARERSVFMAAARRPGAVLAVSLPGGADLAPPFVGRSHELALLERHLAGEGPPLLLLAGEPGIGKTRLLHAATPRAVTQGWHVLEGGCQRRGGQELYAPLLGALQRHIRGRRPAQLRADLQGCAWLVRLLPELADSPIPPLPAWMLTAEQERRLMIEAVARLLTNIAGPAGTLLLLDDLQWAGPDALDLLATLARSAAEAPLRLIGTYRDTEVQPHDPLSALLADLAHAGLAARRLLGPLAPAEAAQLLDAVLAPQDAEESPLRAQMLQRTGGVPFFVVSCAQGWRRDGADGMGDAVPWDVGQSVRQRVVALPVGARDLIGTAAVVGRVVPRTLLASVAVRPEEDVVTALDALCHARLLDDQGGETYQFAHDVIREVVEADLGTARRTLLHRRIAQTLEQQRDADVEAIAYHYALAGEHADAARWLERAGGHAAAGFSNAAAIEHYAAARDHVLASSHDSTALSRLDEKLGDVRLLVGDLPQAQDDFARARAAETQATRRAELWFKEGLTHRWRFDFAGTLAAFAAAEAEGEAEGTAQALPRSLRADLEAIRGEFYSWRGDFEAAERAARQAIALLNEEKAGKTTDLARSSAVFLQGQVAAGRGEYERAERLFCDALEVQERYGDQEQIHRTLLYLGDLARSRGRFATAEQLLQRGLAIGEQIGNQRQIAVCWNNLSLVALARGNLAQAEEYGHNGRRLAERVGFRLGIFVAWLNLGQVALRRGDLAAAEGYFQRAWVASDEMRSQDHQARASLQMGQAACECGNLCDAAARFRAARRRGRQTGNRPFEALATIAQAGVRLHQGRLRAATLLLAQGRAPAERHGWVQAMMQATLLQVELLLHQGELDAAHVAAEAALRRATGEERRYDEALVHRYLGQCALAQGRPAVAESHLRTALALQTELDAALEAARTRVVLAEALMGEAKAGVAAREAHALLMAAQAQFAASGAAVDLAHAQQIGAAWALGNGPRDALDLRMSR